MSVLKANRNHGRMEAIASALALTKYTLSICNNEKYFHKRYRWILTVDIVTECKQAFLCLRRVDNFERMELNDGQIRTNLREEAFWHLENMLSYIQIAYEQFNLPPKKVSYWTGLILDTENKINMSNRHDYMGYKLRAPLSYVARSTPNTGNANNTRNINTTGNLDNNNANNNNGLAPDFKVDNKYSKQKSRAEISK